MLRERTPITKSLIDKYKDYKPPNKQYNSHNINHIMHSHSQQTPSTSTFFTSASSLQHSTSNKNINIDRKRIDFNDQSNNEETLYNRNTKEIIKIKDESMNNEFKLNYFPKSSSLNQEQEDDKLNNSNIKTLIKERRKIDENNILKCTVKSHQNYHYHHQQQQQQQQKNIQNKCMNNSRQNSYSNDSTNLKRKKLSFPSILDVDDDDNNSNNNDQNQQKSLNRTLSLTQDNTHHQQHSMKYDDKSKNLTTDRRNEQQSYIKKNEEDTGIRLKTDKNSRNYEFPRTDHSRERINERIFYNNNKPPSKKLIPNNYDYKTNVTTIFLWNSDRTAFNCFPVFKEKDLKFNDHVQRILNETHQDDDCETQTDTLIKAVCQNYKDLINGINENIIDNSYQEVHPAYEKNMLTYYKTYKEDKIENSDIKTYNKNNYGLNKDQQTKITTDINNKLPINRGIIHNNNSNSQSIVNPSLNYKDNSPEIKKIKIDESQSDKKINKKEESSSSSSSSSSGNGIYKLFTGFVTKITGCRSQ